MVRIGVITFCSFILLGSILLAGFEILNRTDVAPAVAQLRSVQIEFLDDYLKDQSDLASVPLLNQTFSRTNDAGTLLNPVFAWHPGFEGEDSVPAKGTPLAIKERYKEALLRYGKDWIAHNSWFNQEAFDYKIFEQIRPFDHWDLEINSPIEKVGSATSPYLNSIELPIPDVTDIVVLSQLYMMKAIDTKQTMQTLKDVRHLAELMLSSENMSLEMTALRLLDYERVAYNHYIKNKLLNESDWEPLSATVISQATRAWPATAGYLRVITHEKTFTKVFGNQMPVGLCAAVNTSAPHDILLKPMLLPRFFLEVDFRDHFARHEQLLNFAKGRCRLKYVTRLMSAGQSYDRLPMPSLFAYLPYSRRTYGMKLATVGFTGFETYADPLNRQRDPSAQ